MIDQSDAKAIEDAVKRGVLAALVDWFDQTSVQVSTPGLRTTEDWRRFADKIRARRAA